MQLFSPRDSDGFFLFFLCADLCLARQEFLLLLLLLKLLLVEVLFVLVRRCGYVCVYVSVCLYVFFFLLGMYSIV